MTSTDVQIEQALAFGRSRSWMLAHIPCTRRDIYRAVARMDAAAADNDDDIDPSYLKLLPPGEHAAREALIESIITGAVHLPHRSRSPELVEAVRRLAATGHSDPVIGERIGRSASAIRSMRIRYCIPPGGPSMRWDRQRGSAAS